MYDDVLIMNVQIEIIWIVKLLMSRLLQFTNYFLYYPFFQKYITLVFSKILNYSICLLHLQSDTRSSSSNSCRSKDYCNILWNTNINITIVESKATIKYKSSRTVDGTRFLVVSIMEKNHSYERKHDLEKPILIAQIMINFRHIVPK